jgi:hypothetical protein
MSDLKTQIYHHLDKNGIKGNFSVSMGVAFNVDERSVETRFPKTFRLSSNQFGLTDEEYEKIILEYIYDTVNIRIDSLVNIDKYSSNEGLPFIVEIFKDGDYQPTFTLAFGTINGTLILTDTDKIVSLGNIETINGDLKFKGSSIKSLGNLKTVNGSIYVRQFDPPFTNLASLENLEEVSGNLIVKSSPLVDLGNLKKVGGTLNLRKTNISSLGKLEYVGGDLFLPKAKKGILDASKVSVVGNLKYFSN